MGEPRDFSVDPKMMEQILGQNDEALKQTVRAAAEAAGMNRMQAEFMTRDAGMIRRKLGSFSEQDIRKLLSSVSPEQLAALAEQMKKLQK